MANKYVKDIANNGINYIRLYSIYARIHQKLVGTPSKLPGDVATSDDAELEQWSALWEAMHPAIARYWNMPRSTLDALNLEGRNNTIPPETPEVILAQDRELAEDCLCRMQEMEDVANPGNTVDRPPIFPDKLVTAVGLFVLPDRVRNFPRLERLLSEESPSVSDAVSNVVAVELAEVEDDASDEGGESEASDEEGEESEVSDEEGGESEVSGDEEVESEVSNYEERRAG